MVTRNFHKGYLVISDRIKPALKLGYDSHLPYRHSLTR